MARKPRLPQPLEIEGLTQGRAEVQPFVDELSGAMIEPSAPIAPLSPQEMRSEYLRKHGHKAKVESAPLPRYQLTQHNGQLALTRGLSVPIVPRGKHIVGTVEVDGATRYVLKDNPPWRR